MRTSGGDRLVSHEGGAGGAAQTGSLGGAGDGAGGGGGLSISTSDGRACLARCCDGTTLESDETEPLACERTLGYACADHGGPVSIFLEADLLWSAEGACPTMKGCVANCCNGALMELSPAFDGALCAADGQASTTCDGMGGVAQVTFGGEAVWQELVCAGNCEVVCCDTAVMFGPAQSATECELRAAGACPEPTGGPSLVAFDHSLVWSALGQCPSLRACRMGCGDGTDVVSLQYQAKVCIGDCLAGDGCAGHGDPQWIYFDGDQVWKAP
ncbi:MAG: hypothetical protein R3B70_04145 [Polyangiaceae bacterium]